MREYNFDGIVGPTHLYAGLSAGNLASTESRGQLGNPRAAALQGLEKMRFVASLGVGQAVLPPQPRPDLRTLRQLGFSGDDAAVLRKAATSQPEFLRLCSSASAMWTANAATIAASADTDDGKLHATVANLNSMFHRSLEAPLTSRVLARIFADETQFCVHDALPNAALFGDEGAANHTRFSTRAGNLHLFGYGRSALRALPRPQAFIARQTLEASLAVARANHVREERALFWQQEPSGIDAGAFHTDVLAVGNGNFFMLHEQAFSNAGPLLQVLSNKLGPDFRACVATESELPVRDAVRSYPFNSQLVTLPDESMAIVAPREAHENPNARRFLERVVSEDNPVRHVHYIDVNASMQNGGGPACLRLRVPLTDRERAAISTRVFFDASLHDELKAWIERHYRDRLSFDDLADPELLREVERALDELTRLLALGSVFDFQRV
jgi:succinylarginine dihydrolase